MAILILAADNSVIAAKQSSKSLEFQEEAKSYLEKGDLKSAIIQLKNAIRADPGNVQARFDLAIIYLRGRDGPSAEKELKASRKSGMDPDRIWLPLARAYALQGKHREILDEIVPDKQTGQLKANMLAARGAAYGALKQLDKAEAALNQAVAAAPKSPFVLLAFSQVLQARGKFEEAEAQVDLVLSLEPENSRALLRKGAMQQTRRDFAGAVETFGKVIAANEGSVPARLARAGGYVAMNDDARARTDVAVALEYAPTNPIARYLNALLLAREKKYQESADMLLPVLQSLREYAPALYLAASLDFAQGRIEQAQTGIQAYLAKVPDSPRGLRMLAAVYLRKRLPEKAIEILEPMAQTTPENVNLLTMLGNAYVAVGRNSEATVLFEKVARTNPENSSVRTRLALTKLNSGDQVAAVREFESILEKDPDETQANLLLVLTHLRAQNYERALKSATELKARMPNSPIPDNFLGTIFLGRKDTQKAREHFAKALKIQPDFTPAALNLAEIDRAGGKADDARKRYEAILEKDKKHLQAMLRLSQLAFSQKDNAQGLDWLQRAVRENPKALRPRLALVNALLQSKDNHRAMTSARELVQIAEKSPEALDALARAQMAADRIPSAVATYRQVIKLAPKSAAAHHRFARALMASKDFTAAGKALDDAIKLDPGLLAAREDRVAIALQEEGPEAALHFTEKMIAESPDMEFGYVLKGDVLMRNGSPAEASKAYTDALQRNATSRTVSRLYQSQSRAGDKSGARKTLTTWLQSNPEDSAIRFILASDLIRNGEFAAAIRQNETLLNKFPRNAVLLNDLAWLYGETGDNRAVEYAEQAHELAPKSPAISDTLGWLLVRKGETEKGLAHLKDARAGAPDQLDIGYHYAAALAKAGREKEATKVLRDVLDTGRPFSAIEEARKLYATLARK